MMLFSLLVISCEQPAIEPKLYADLLNSGNCPKEDTKCSIEECKTFFANPPKAESPSEENALYTLCRRLDEENTPIKQACGLPACFILPELHPKGAMTILQDGISQTAAERIARQTIIRGLIEHKRFTSFLQDAQNSDKWLNVAVSEALCEESSAAKQLSITCQPTNKEAAQAAWGIAQKHPVDSTSYRSALNLAMILDTKGIAALVLSLLLDESMDAKERKAAAQAIHFAQYRGYKMKPEFQALINQRCVKGDPPLALLCR